METRERMLLEITGHRIVLPPTYFVCCSLAEMQRNHQEYESIVGCLCVVFFGRKKDSCWAFGLKDELCTHSVSFSGLETSL